MSQLLKFIFIICLSFFQVLRMSAQTNISPKQGYLAGEGNFNYKTEGTLKSISKVALSEFHSGMTFGFKAKSGYLVSQEGLAQLDSMAKLNIKWISLVVNVMQETVFSTRVFNDFEYSASDAEIELFVDACHKKGIRVNLYLLLDMYDSQARQNLQFPDVGEVIMGVKVDYWKLWFASYTRMAVNYARLCQRKEVELLTLGGELNGTFYQEEHWNNLIDKVKNEYRGPLTYGMLKYNINNLPKWIHRLDLLGISCYPSFADSTNATEESLTIKARKFMEQVKALHKQTNLPVVFTEVGALSMKGTLIVPWNYKTEGGCDVDNEQATFINVLLSAFQSEPWWRGMYWWKWDEHQKRPQLYDDPKCDKSFTISNKPASIELKKWYAIKNAQ